MLDKDIGTTFLALRNNRPSWPSTRTYEANGQRDLNLPAGCLDPDAGFKNHA
jgi:hypothetical protein